MEQLSEKILVMGQYRLRCEAVKNGCGRNAVVVAVSSSGVTSKVKLKYDRRG